MNVLVSGATGLVGSVLVPSLAQGGHAVSTLVRLRPVSGTRSIPWDPASGRLEPSALEGIDAVVHLAGESIVGRWTQAKKQRILISRVQGTTLLAQALGRMSRPPRVLISASAIGYYGDRGDELLDEQSPAGQGFLPEVCRAWEAATAPAQICGIRVVSLRLGIVLSRRGGALAAMLLPFQLGLGGRLGHGRQYWSWVAIDDVAGAIVHVLQTETLAGPVNVVVPNPVTNAEFTRILGRVLKRPTLIPVPKFAPRLVMGDMADALLFASARVVPRQLEASGYPFRFSVLEDALRFLLTTHG